MTKQTINEELNIDNWATIYKELADLIGTKNTLKIYNNYKGVDITFPMKLFTSRGFINVIHSQYNGTNARDIAQKYGYSTRHIYKLIKESTEKD